MKKLHNSLALAALAANVLMTSRNDAVADAPVAGTTDTSGLTVTPVAKTEPKEPKAPSKAEISRGIMKSFHAEGKDYEAIIAEMMRVNGYDRQLARGTYKANFTKAGVPAPVEGKRPTKKAETPAADSTATPAGTEAAATGDSAPAGEAAPV